MDKEDTHKKAGKKVKELTWESDSSPEKSSLCLKEPKPKKKLLMKSLELKVEDIGYQLPHVSSGPESVKDNMHSDYDRKIKVKTKTAKTKKKNASKPKGDSKSVIQTVTGKNITRRRKMCIKSEVPSSAECEENRELQTESNKEMLENNYNDMATVSVDKEKVGMAAEPCMLGISEEDPKCLHEDQAQTSSKTTDYSREESKESTDKKQSTAKKPSGKRYRYKQDGKNEVAPKVNILRSPYPKRKKTWTEISEELADVMEVDEEVGQPMLSGGIQTEHDNNIKGVQAVTEVTEAKKRSTSEDRAQSSSSRDVDRQHATTIKFKKSGSQKTLLNEGPKETVISLEDFREFQKFKVAQEKKKKKPAEDEITALEAADDLVVGSNRNFSLHRLAIKQVRSASRNTGIIGDAVIHKVDNPEGVANGVEKKVSVVSENYQPKLRKKGTKATAEKLPKRIKSSSSRDDENPCENHQKDRTTELKEKQDETAEPTTKKRKKSRYPIRRSSKDQREQTTKVRSNRSKGKEKSDSKKLPENKDTFSLHSTSHESVLKDAYTPTKEFKIPKLSKPVGGIKKSHSPHSAEPTTISTSPDEKKPKVWDVLEDIGIDDLVGQSMEKNKPHPFDVVHPIEENRSVHTNGQGNFNKGPLIHSIMSPEKSQVPTLAVPDEKVPLCRPKLKRCVPAGVSSGTTVLPIPVDFKSKPPPLMTGHVSQMSPTPTNMNTLHGFPNKRSGIEGSCGWPNANDPETWKPVFLGVVDQCPGNIGTREYNTSPFVKKNVVPAHIPTDVNESEMSQSFLNIGSSKWTSPSLRDPRGTKVLDQQMGNDQNPYKGKERHFVADPEWVIPHTDLGNLLECDDLSQPAFSALDVNDVEIQLKSLQRRPEECSGRDTHRHPSLLHSKKPTTSTKFAASRSMSPCKSLEFDNMYPLKKRTARMSVQPGPPVAVMKDKAEDDTCYKINPDQARAKNSYDDDLFEAVEEDEDWPYLKSPEKLDARITPQKDRREDRWINMPHGSVSQHLKSQDPKGISVSLKVGTQRAELPKVKENHGQKKAGKLNVVLGSALRDQKFKSKFDFDSGSRKTPIKRSLFSDNILDQGNNSDILYKYKPAEIKMPKLDAVSPYHYGHRSPVRLGIQTVSNQRKSCKDENQNVTLEPDRNTRDGNGIKQQRPRTADSMTQTDITVVKNEGTQMPESQDSCGDEFKGRHSGATRTETSKSSSKKRVPGAGENRSYKAAKKQKTSDGLKKATNKVTDLEIFNLKELQSDILRRTGTHGRWFLGANVPVVGGVHKAVYNAVKIGARAFGMLLTTPRAWVSKELSETDIQKFKDAMKEFKFNTKMVVVQGSSVMNCGSGDEAMLQKSRQLLLDEVQKTEQLGLSLYTIHPGSARGAVNREICRNNMADSINYVLNRTENVTILLENMCGPTHVIGCRFAELQSILEEVDNQSRVGVCFNTCNAFAAGYDLKTKEGYEAMMDEIEMTVGRPYLKAIHLTDSKGELGCQKAQPENIGRGQIGEKSFRCLMQDLSNEDIPIVLETPGNNFAQEIKLLNAFINDEY